MPGSAGSDVAPRPLGQRQAISIKGLTPGVAYHLAACCHPIPGDRIVGLRREDESIEVHVIGCDKLASGIDADWLDLAWGDESDGGTARLCVILRDVAGRAGRDGRHPRRARAPTSSISHLAHRDGSFHTFHLDVEVHDLAHLHSLLAALRAADPVSARPSGSRLSAARGTLRMASAPPAASTASVTRSDELAVIGAIWTGSAMPIR